MVYVTEILGEHRETRPVECLSNFLWNGIDGENWKGKETLEKVSKPRKF